jgi:hypothetical protein
MMGLLFCFLFCAAGDDTILVFCAISADTILLAEDAGGKKYQ